jgi:AcrR family transcriptional regulator
MPTRTRAPRAASKPKLSIKTRPTQQRAHDTYEQILAATAQLLGQVGIERLSTNLICQQLGLSPPALYHYFPNKYAIVHELGVRLMQAQDAVVATWATPQTLALPAARLQRALAAMLGEMFRFTAQRPEGVWVLRALRAVPALQAVRIQSHERVSQLFVDAFRQAYPEVDLAGAQVIARVAVDMGSAGMDLLFDAPQFDPAAVADTLAAMMTSQVVALRKASAG